jgi:pantothenate kinase
MHLELLDAAAGLITPLVDTGRRIMVGIAGPPGAGKSTLAEALARKFQDAVAVPMDGFHLAQAELHRLGLAHRKGAPATFDAYGFVHLLRRLREGSELVYAPTYSRVVHESIGSAIPIFASTRLLVVEGNYLLLPDQPWAQVPDLLDLTIYVDAPERERVDGLLRRQRGFGLDAAAAKDWVERSDEANARLIAAHRDRAAVILTRTS